MKKLILAILLFTSSIPLFGYCEEIQTYDKNKDGKTDSWIYRDDKGVPTRWIRDSNFDGKEDQWLFFKQGKAFLDEEDLDGDGKVDRIIIHVYDLEHNKSRSISILLKDARKNIFIENEDTGWQPMNLKRGGSSPAEGAALEKR